MKNVKWNEIDQLAFDRAQELTGNAVTREYFDTLFNIKMDSEANLALGWKLYMRKDYKNFDFKNNITGISSTFTSLHDTCAKYGQQDFEENIQGLMDQNNLKIYIVMTNFFTAKGDGSRLREFVIHTNKPEKLELLKKLKDFLDTQTEKFQLETLELPDWMEKDQYFGWTFHNLSMSRKKWEPVLRDFF